MSKEKAPAFQFYPKDVLSDGNAMAMPLECFGAYMKLLCYDWIDDGIPDDAKIWRRLCGYEHFNYQGDERDIEDWDIIASYLRPQFVNHPNKSGYLTNSRLQRERKKQQERSSSAQSSANMRWDSERSANAMPNDANAVRTQCSSSSSSSSSNLDTSIKEPLPQVEGKTERAPGVFISEIEYEQGLLEYSRAGLKPLMADRGLLHTSRHLSQPGNSHKNAYVHWVTWALRECLNDQKAGLDAKTAKARNDRANGTAPPNGTRIIPNAEQTRKSLESIIQAATPKVST